jgi:hypothetical protein
MGYLIGFGVLRDGPFAGQRWLFSRSENTMVRSLALPSQASDGPLRKTNLPTALKNWTE